MLDQEKIGKYIASLRKEKKLTQEQLAEKLGVSNRSISRWENGRSMPELSMLPVIGEELGVSVSELLTGETSAENGNEKENIGLITMLFWQEKRRKAKRVTGYFLCSLLCTLVVILHMQSGILKFAENPGLLTGLLIVAAILCEAAGFYCNWKERKLTEKEMEILFRGNEFVKMKTAGEMLQFARKNQKVELKQYEKGFQAIEGKLQPEETAHFSMVADTFVVNEAWTDSWSPWHVTLAVTERRLMVCGEAIHGRFMTFYDVESFPLEEILSVEFLNRKMIIKMESKQLKIEGENLETVTGLLKNALNR